MKSSVFLAAIASLAAHLVDAHYTIPDLIIGSTVTADWQYVRRTDNQYSQSPIQDVTLSTLKCYESTTASATSTATVAAGSVIGFKADNSFYHPGYYDIYMCAVPLANVESAGNSACWFKVYEKLPTYTPGSVYAFDETSNTMTFTIPPSLPSGQYLVRAEHIALHVAYSTGGAQFYLSCAQINVTGGGSGTPGPLVSIPGVYKATDPGILININQAATGPYPAPGPPVWPSSGGGGGGTTTTTSHAVGTTTSKSTTTTTPVVYTTTTTASGPTQTHYGQCGGQGWTGPTSCASPYTCKVSSQYYSQCL